MRFSERFKIIWWIVLIVLATSFLYSRRDYLLDEQVHILEFSIFIIWVGLLLIPLFNEFEMFGFRLRQEIKGLKTEVKGLQNLIQNFVNVNKQIGPSIYMTPPSDASIPVIEERSRSILNEVQKNLDINENVKSKNIPEISDNVSYLFAVRYHIERELRRIWNHRFSTEEHRKRTISIQNILQQLVSAEVIDFRFANVISEVYSICSPAIHGEEVSERRINFVRDIASDLINTLNAIE
ncbi:hypothetical protein [Natranaerobius thermophilus]|uniref:Uncharacterized protein n=1 Tax=Natranaerobius thermophilus (strain ATCC BAA-1301 / DSM 18059 / JW/NM-WN-LF) TaxID=457570 RepID=B2A117_NATTJ|nr:hypothetical protein [Natranaerobius thermophilus]ACB84640.1 hypothetical protein Nther_1056 [Natranaerobius thermophilus JW/NM-WN-LF]